MRCKEAPDVTTFAAHGPLLDVLVRETETDGTSMRVHCFTDGVEKAYPRTRAKGGMELPHPDSPTHWTADKKPLFAAPNGDGRPVHSAEDATTYVSK